MSALEQYLKDNRERAYIVAENNTKYNENGRPMVSDNDEWIDETEWDEVFEQLKKEKCKDK